MIPIPVLLTLALQSAASPLNLFQEPFRLKLSNNKFISAPSSSDFNFAPLYVDFDDDGVKDLLVGTFHVLTQNKRSGRLRVYHNYGTEAKPEFRHFRYFEVDHKPFDFDCG